MTTAPERSAIDARATGPKASVIVPVRNGAADIAALLECLERQTLPRSDFEIVIGDDGSTDGGTERIETPDGHIRVAAGPPRNSYAARNRAVAASTAPVLAFCDADCLPEPDWLERGLASLATTDMAAGRIRFVVPEDRTAWTLVDMDGSKDHEHQVRVGIAETANLFLRRELFDRVGGFEGEIAEYGDYDFVTRCVSAGADLSFAADSVVWHPARTSGRTLLRALWKYNRGYAVHVARAGVTPEGVMLRSWVPFVQTYRARRRWGRSFGPDRRWLRLNGVEPTLRETFYALAIMYVILPYLGGIAQLAGWLSGLRLRRADRRGTVRAEVG
jgi:glycosyltransferase involved in cell wall biosynthesis